MGHLQYDIDRAGCRCCAVLSSAVQWCAVVSSGVQEMYGVSRYITHGEDTAWIDGRTRTSELLSHNCMDEGRYTDVYKQRWAHRVACVHRR